MSRSRVPDFPSCSSVGLGGTDSYHSMALNFRVRLRMVRWYVLGKGRLFFFRASDPQPGPLASLTGALDSLGRHLAQHLKVQYKGSGRTGRNFVLGTSDRARGEIKREREVYLKKLLLTHVKTS